MIPAQLLGPINQRVLHHRDGKSAHSDVVDALQTAVEPLGDVQLFCPDWQQCRYVVASTQGIIMAFALGMNTVGFRLDERIRIRALASGAEPSPECGEEWVTFTLFRDDWPRADLEFWARKTYVTARETVP